MKKCKKCGVERILDLFYRKYSTAKKAYYYAMPCKICQREHGKRNRIFMDICKKCGCKKNLTKGYYCPDCNKKYTLDREKDYKNRVKPTVEQLQPLINRILLQNRNCSMQDANEIITHYMNITNSYSEYDDYSETTQIMLMFERILKYVRDIKLKIKDKVNKKDLSVKQLYMRKYYQSRKNKNINGEK